jgi:hypothetical protein
LNDSAHTSVQLTDQEIAFLSFWDALRGDRDMPDRSELFPENIQRWIGSLHLLEVLDDGNDFLYRIFGTVPSESIGADFHLKRVSELKEEWIERALAFYRAAFEAEKPVYKATQEVFGAHGPKVFSRTVVPFASLSGEGGSRSVSHLLVHLHQHETPIETTLTLIHPPFETA